jgi:hypothetical protein
MLLWADGFQYSLPLDGTAREDCAIAANYRSVNNQDLGVIEVSS